MEPYPVHMRIMPRGAPGSLVAALGGKVVVPLKPVGGNMVFLEASARGPLLSLGIEITEDSVRLTRKGR
jgi:hypothetical protein